jgi:hypothetical protein
MVARLRGDGLNKITIIVGAVKNAAEEILVESTPYCESLQPLLG